MYKGDFGYKSTLAESDGTGKQGSEEYIQYACLCGRGYRV